jgi:hypothetical protein
MRFVDERQRRDASLHPAACELDDHATRDIGNGEEGDGIDDAHVHQAKREALRCKAHRRAARIRHFLVDFRNRLAVLFEWAWAYLTLQRSSRVILEAPEGPRAKATSAPVGDAT